MTVNLDFTAKHKAWPQSRTVTVILRRNAVDQVIECRYVTKRGLRRTDYQFGAVALRGDERVLNIAAAELHDEAGEAYDLLVGDRIVEASLGEFDDANPDQVSWRVVSVELLTFETRWRAVCRQER